ncbi:MAG: 5-oxoprolinase subunit PxpB [Syntrophorhabdaceae bacterium]|nr:5-oxoprolinase subunit PxpB [Syntrophorhabdaceae bacterium]
MEYFRYGEDGIRVVFGKEINEETSERLISFYYAIRSLNIKGIFDIIPSFTVCLIRFDSNFIDYDDLVSTIKDLDKTQQKFEFETRLHEIPVKYGGEEGPDLSFVASHTGLTEDEVIKIHSSTVYTVFTIGFMPGFPYLGTVDKRLFSPRLTTPRTKVPEGSVGIAQLQTGIYPFESPGGWQIIGRTHIKLFDYRKPPYSLLQIGDRVKFVPI